MNVMQRVRYVTVKEAVARTGLAERTVRKLITQGRLTVVRPAGMRTVRIPERELEALMRSRSPTRAGGAGR